MKKLFLLLALALSFTLTINVNGQAPSRHTNGVVLGDPIGTSGDPTGTKEGQIYWNDTLQKFRFYNGTVWADLSTAAASHEGYSESGTRAGADLIVTLGDYDGSSSGVKISIDDNLEIISLGALGTEVRTEGSLQVRSGYPLLLYETGNTFFASISQSLLTTGRVFSLPDQTGTGLVTTDIPIIALNEGNGIGFARSGRTAADYGNIGLNAWDFSLSSGASSTRGATGEFSAAFGDDVTASGYGSFASGFLHVVSNTYGTAFGYDNTVSAYAGFSAGIENLVSGNYGTAFGSNNESTGFYAFTSGTGLKSKNADSFWVGQSNLDYSPTAGINQADHVMFGVGNGTIIAGTPNTRGAPKDAFKIFYDGRAVFGNKTIATSSFDFYENTALTGNTAGITIEQDGTGDALHHFKVPTTSFTMGIDNSVNDDFIIANGASLSDAFFKKTTTALSLGDLGGNDINVILNGWGGNTLMTFGDGAVTLSAGDLIVSNSTGSIKAKKRLFNDVTTAYTLGVNDISGIRTLSNAAAVALTVPTNATTAIAIGTEIVLINKGEGVVTIGGSGVTFRNNVGGLTMAQYDRRLLTKLDTDEWLVSE